MLRAFILTTLISAVFVFPAAAHPAWGIVVDKQGAVYFSDLEAVWKIAPDGKTSVLKTGVSGRHTHVLSIDEIGNIYGDELNYDPATAKYTSGIWKITPTGGFSYVLAPTDKPPKGTSIFKDSNGNAYSVVWNNKTDRRTQIIKRTPNGTVTILGADKNPIENQIVLYSVGGITFDRDSALYFADGSTIKKAAQNGAITVLADKIQIENQPDAANQNAPTLLLGIAFDTTTNSLFVADHGNRRVLKISADGKTSTVIRADAPWSPTGVAVRNGELYILEFGFTLPRTSNGIRVRKLAADGKITTLATVSENNRSSTETSTDNAPQPIKISTAAQPETKTASPATVFYLTLGAGIGILALTVAVWYVRGKTPNH
jgi:hypothetical protein